MYINKIQKGREYRTKKKIGTKQKLNVFRKDDLNIKQHKKNWNDFNYQNVCYIRGLIIV